MSIPITPMEPLPQSDDPEFHSMAHDFEHRFFEGAEQVKVEVVLMHETLDDLLKVIEENDWKPNEGLIILLTTGMAFLRAERALTVSQDAAGMSVDEVKKLLDRSMVIEARYASIKNFAFDIMRDHRTIEIRHAPLEREYKHYKGMVWSLQQEIEDLKAENARLKQDLLAHQASAPPPAEPHEPSNWRQRILQALERYLDDNQSRSR